MYLSICQPHTKQITMTQVYHLMPSQWMIPRQNAANVIQWN